MMKSCRQPQAGQTHTSVGSYVTATRHPVIALGGRSTSTMKSCRQPELARHTQVSEAIR